MLVKKKIRMFNSWFVKIINIKSCGRFFYEYEQSLVWNSEFFFFWNSLNYIHEIIVKVSNENYDTQVLLGSS